MTFRNFFWLSVAAFSFCGISPLHAQWGDFKATFVYQGKLPAPIAGPAAAKGLCGFAVPDDSLTLGPKGEIANVLVYLVPAKGVDVPVHPDITEALKKPITIDNVGCQFSPKVAVMTMGQTLTLGNKDKVGHNAKIDPFNNKPINPIIPPGAKVDQVFPLAEAFPSPVSCAIHPFMKGYLHINSNPYVAVSDATGVLTLKNVPTGTWTFAVWHGTNVTSPLQNGAPVKWPKGRVTVVITAGATTDLGKIEFVATPL